MACDTQKRRRRLLIVIHASNLVEKWENDANFSQNACDPTKTGTTVGVAELHCFVSGGDWHAIHKNDVKGFLECVTACTWVKV